VYHSRRKRGLEKTWERLWEGIFFSVNRSLEPRWKVFISRPETVERVYDRFRGEPGLLLKKIRTVVIKRHGLKNLGRGFTTLIKSFEGRTKF